MGELHVFNLNPIKTQYNCTNYVETGTGIGVCLKHILNYDFNHYYSIDVDGELIEQARVNYPQSNITFIHNYSTDGLKELVPKLPKNESTMFFLDAHFPGADFGKMSYESSIREFREEAFPLIKELEIIQSLRDTSKDVFIIDDWKLYDPTIKCEDPHWDYKGLQEELNLNTPKEPILNRLQKTHDIEIKLNHQGFLFATPK